MWVLALSKQLTLTCNNLPVTVWQRSNPQSAYLCMHALWVQRSSQITSTTGPLVFLRSALLRKPLGCTDTRAACLRSLLARPSRQKGVAPCPAVPPLCPLVCRGYTRYQGRQQNDCDFAQQTETDWTSQAVATPLLGQTQT